MSTATGKINLDPELLEEKKIYIEPDIFTKFDTLVRYEKPVVATEPQEEKTIPEDTLEAIYDGYFDNTTEAVDELLSIVLPPRYWEEDGVLWMQKISNKPSTRQEVIELTTLFNEKVDNFDIRAKGLCPFRRHYYAQMMDELIRQLIIVCPEWGMVLLRCRDEFELTKSVYEQLFISCMANGIKQCWNCYNLKDTLRSRVRELEKEISVLEDIIAEMIRLAAEADAAEAELRNAERRRIMEHISHLKKVNLNLKAQLEGLVAPKKEKEKEVE